MTKCYLGLSLNKFLYYDLTILSFSTVLKKMQVFEQHSP